MRVAVIGSRQCNNLNIDDIISNLPTNCSEIISGGAIGVDQLAKSAAEKIGVSLTEFLPDYKAFGKLAPLKRNFEIIKNSDMVIAFWNMHSSGTRHVINMCIKKKRYFKIIPYKKKRLSALFYCPILFMLHLTS